MWKFLFRTSWHHMSRMPYASCGVIFGFSLLFVTLLMGVNMLRFLEQERTTLESRFTYPLALNPIYTFDSRRVRDFAESLGDIGLSRPLEYITREQALDREIQRNPDIIHVLAGENPLPDTIIIPLQGMNTDMLWTRIQEFRDLFESGTEVRNLRARLERFDRSLVEIREVWWVLLVFISLTLVLMAMVLIAILRYHLRLFQDERIVGRLVGADPVFIW
jgi:cell division protein FtsX